MKYNDYYYTPLNPSLSENIKNIREISGGSSDVLVNEFEAGGVKCALLCCEGMVAMSIISELVFRPITHITLETKNAKSLYEHINNKLLLSADRIEVINYGNLFRTLNSGFAVLIADGADTALAFGVQGYPMRSVNEPSGEANVMGAHDGFVEVIRPNMSLIRRRLKSPMLVLELSFIGSKTQTDICLCYMQDRVPKSLIDRIKKSLDNIDLESVLSTGYIRPFLESRRLEIFSSTGTTERPDVLCSKLIEGRVAILIDGIPFAIVIPKLFCESFQTLDDYAYKPYYAVFIRWIKYFAFLIAILLPSLYVAISLHHPELLNPQLLMILVEAEESAPVSLLAEGAGVLLLYEIIREAGLRLPKVVGGAVSIVGGLIIGDSAVQSGLVSTPMLTIIALAVTSGFVVPEINQSVTILRFVFLFAGGLLGLFGISLVACVVLVNICATEDYGFPYTAPISPFKKKAMRDTLGRIGFRKMQKGEFTVEEYYE